MKEYKTWMFRIVAVLIIIAMISLAIWMSNANAKPQSNHLSNAGEEIPLSVTFSAADINSDYDRKLASKIIFNEDSIQLDGIGATKENNVVTILYGGVYELSGAMSDGQVIVQANDGREVRLVFNGLQLSSEDSAPIYIKQAEKTVITLVEGSSNTLSDGNAYTLAEAEDDDPATIFSKDDLVINGSGKLTVQGNAAHGIVSKDKLTIISGDIAVDAASDGIRGRDVIAIRDGQLTINAGNDGLKSNNDELDQEGYIFVENGQFNINSGHDGMQAAGHVVLMDGQYNITANGGYVNAAARAAEMFGPGGGNFGNFGGNAQRGTRGDEANMQTMLEQLRNDDGTFTLPDGTTVTEDELTAMMSQFGRGVGGTQPSMPEGMTGGGTPPSMPEGMTGGGTPPSMPEGMTGGGTPPSMPEGMTGGGTQPSMPEEMTGGGTPPSMPEGMTGGGTPPSMPEGKHAVEGMTDIGTPPSILSSDDDVEEEQAGLTESDSYKGIKAGGYIWIEDGKYTIDTADDAMHADGAVTITAGDFTISSGDDAIRSAADLTIYNGQIEVVTSYEGIEGEHVTIYDGKLTINATDDGINTVASEVMQAETTLQQNEQATNSDNVVASDMQAQANDRDNTAQRNRNNTRAAGPGGMMEVSDGSSLTIYGGEIVIYASGDGIDSNGDITIHDGFIVSITDSSIGGDGGIDVNGELIILGGTILGGGPYEASPSAQSSQPSVYYSASSIAAAGAKIEIYDGEQLLYELQSKKGFSNLLFSSSALAEDNLYTLSINGVEQSLTAQISPEGAGTMGGGPGFGQAPGGFGRFGGQQSSEESNTSN